jgi:hypothetical protein
MAGRVSVGSTEDFGDTKLLAQTKLTANAQAPLVLWQIRISAGGAWLKSLREIV